jgi:hypothetical protein
LELGGNYWVAELAKKSLTQTGCHFISVKFMGDTADTKSEWKRVLGCLSPLLFPAFGFIVGVSLSIFLPGGPWWGLAAKLLMVCYSLLGWAIGVCFVQQKRLYCGATQAINDEEWPMYSRRYGVGASIVFTGFLLSTIGIFGASNATNLGISPVYGFLVYFSLLPTTFSILVGEIGWGDPLTFFKMFTDFIKK